MPRYIDAYAFLKKIERFSLSNGTTLGKHSGVADEIIDVLMAEPTADVVEVVRCRECKHWTPMDDGISWHNRGRTDGMCEMLYQMHYAERHLTSETHYCGYGERKEQP